MKKLITATALLAIAIVCGAWSFGNVRIGQFRKAAPSTNAPSFSPSDIAGLFTWLDAATNVSTSGGTVTQWVDRASGITFTNAYINAGESYISNINGQVITFKTGLRSNVKFTLGNNCTVVSILRTNGANIFYNRVLDYHYTRGFWFGYHAAAGTNISIGGWAANYAPYGAALPFSANLPIVSVLKMTNSTSVLFSINSKSSTYSGNAAITTGDLNELAVSCQVVSDGGGSANPGSLKIYELLVYTNAVSDSDVYALINYYSNKFGITP